VCWFGLLCLQVQAFEDVIGKWRAAEAEAAQLKAAVTDTSRQLAQVGRSALSNYPGIPLTGSGCYPGNPTSRQLAQVGRSALSNAETARPSSPPSPAHSPPLRAGAACTA
jgi:hypothetical protein